MKSQYSHDPKHVSPADVAPFPQSEVAEILPDSHGASMIDMHAPATLHQQMPPIIFRDLKPSNVMVTGREEIKLIDFGIARTFQSQHQLTIIMTPGYAPPEQLYGRAEPRSDIYALGATLHKALTYHDASNNQPGIFSFPAVRALRPDISPAFRECSYVTRPLHTNPAVQQMYQRLRARLGR